MTILLTRDIALADTLLSVDHPEEASLDDVLKIDSELVVVRGRPSTGPLLVGRGFLGSTRATHSSGTEAEPFSLEAGGGGGSISATDGETTVDPATSLRFPAGTLSDLGEGVAGVGLVTYLVGPYTITKDTPNLDAGVSLLTLPIGAIVVRAWIIVTTPFAPTERTLGIYIGGPGFDFNGDGDDDNLIFYGSAGSDLASNVLSTHYVAEPRVGPDQIASETPHYVSRVAFATLADARLVVGSSNIGDASAGSLDVYAIIATPAS